MKEDRDADPILADQFRYARPSASPLTPHLSPLTPHPHAQLSCALGDFIAGSYNVSDERHAVYTKASSSRRKWARTDAAGGAGGVGRAGRAGGVGGLSGVGGVGGVGEVTFSFLTLSFSFRAAALLADLTLYVNG